MNGGITGRKFFIGCGLAGVGLAAIITTNETRGDEVSQARSAAVAPVAQASGRGFEPQASQLSSARQGEVLQALEDLTQIRKEQCQSGNQLACQVLTQMPGYGRQLSQLDETCQSGD